jgi:hypothetical protein
MNIQKVFVLFYFYHPTNRDVRYIDFGSIDTPVHLECPALAGPGSS